MGGKFGPRSDGRAPLDAVVWEQVESENENEKKKKLIIEPDRPDARNGESIHHNSQALHGDERKPERGKGWEQADSARGSEERIRIRRRKAGSFDVQLNPRSASVLRLLQAWGLVGGLERTGVVRPGPTPSVGTSCHWWENGIIDIRQRMTE